MNDTDPTAGDQAGQSIRRFGWAGLRQLHEGLIELGYQVIGPQIRDGVIVHAALEAVEDLPLGWTDEQTGGRYRLVPRNDRARFGYAVGPESLKRSFQPPRQQVWTMTRTADGALDVQMSEPEPARTAFFGVRPCELAAMGKQDRVLADGPHPDPAYRSNREDVFIVAVDCGDPADTCFCASMDTGPQAGPGYDLALTELVPAGAGAGAGDGDGDGDGDGEPGYVIRIGSDAGAAVMASVATEPTTEEDRSAAVEVVERAAASMTRRIDGQGIRDLIYDHLESDQWESIAERCLSCGNCTMVCPTCFCTDLVDVTDLAGDTATRWRVWDTCFSTEFSHLGPGPVRESTASRYRQWFVHKLASWHDQFGESGCVGCGRCITWCPVGIDLTAELAAMRAGAAS